MNSKVIHIIEPLLTGHRYQYIRRIIVYLAQFQHQLVLSTYKENENNPLLHGIKESAGKSLTIRYIDENVLYKNLLMKLYPPIFFWLLLRLHSKQISRIHHSDLVVVPYIDYILNISAIIGSPFGTIPFCGIVMRGDFQWQSEGVKAPYGRWTLLKKQLFTRFLKNEYLRSVATIDPSLKNWAHLNCAESMNKICYIADPSDVRGFGDANDAKSRFGIKNDNITVLIYGSIDLRKGLKKCIETLRKSRLVYNLLIVGKETKIASEYLDSVSEENIQLIRVNEYASTQDEWLAFQVADYIWLVYDGFFGPSGVLSQASQMGKKVIYSDMGLIGYHLLNHEFEMFESSDYKVTVPQIDFVAKYNWLIEALSGAPDARWSDV